jgi:hypothetical protein
MAAQGPNNLLPPGTVGPTPYPVAQYPTDIKFTQSAHTKGRIDPATWRTLWDSSFISVDNLPAPISPTSSTPSTRAKGSYSLQMHSTITSAPRPY